MLLVLFAIFLSIIQFFPHFLINKRRTQNRKVYPIVEKELFFIKEQNFSKEVEEQKLSEVYKKYNYNYFRFLLLTILDYFFRISVLFIILNLPNILNLLGLNQIDKSFLMINNILEINKLPLSVIFGISLLQLLPSYVSVFSKLKNENYKNKRLKNILLIIGNTFCQIIIMYLFSKVLNTLYFIYLGIRSIQNIIIKIIVEINMRNQKKQY